MDHFFIWRILRREIYRLSNHDKLPVFRQGPEFVIDHDFKFVNIVTNRVEVTFHFVAISNRFFSNVFDLVSFFSRVNHLVNIRFDHSQMFGDFHDHPDLCCHRIRFHADAFQTFHIFGQCGLIMNSGRNDMIEMMQ